MPNTQKRADPPTEEEKARIVVGADPDRFYCPHPGCNRSFAELWRLKVHYRAPPDVRGSGKERGHGTELKFCPKCGKDLRPGKHHVGCSAGKSAPRQAAKRQRQQQMSTTTESAQGATAATTTEHTSSSWEQAVRRQAVKQRAASEADSAPRGRRAEACRIESLVQKLDARQVGGPDPLLFHSNPHAVAVQQQHAAAGEHQAAMAPQHFFPPNGAAQQQAAGLQPAPQGHLQQAAIQQQYYGQPQQQQVPQYAAQHMPAQLPHLDLPQHGDPVQLRSFSPSPLELFGDPFGATNGHGNGSGSSAASEQHHIGSAAGLLAGDDELRIPSPPPLPADWDVAPRGGMLFDFDQFDVSKRQQVGTSAPLVTVTTAMNPLDVLNPSDDYIWQIMFAGENDVVPKRVTAHLHHPPANALNYLEEGDPLLDAILTDDLEHSLPLVTPPQQAPSPLGGQAPSAGAQQQHYEQQQQLEQQPHQQQEEEGMLPSLGAVFQQHPPRNGFGSHGHHGSELVVPGKLEQSSFV